MLVIFPLAVPPFASEFSLQGATPAAGLWIAAMLGGLPILIPLVASLIATYAFGARRRWASRLAAALGVSCLFAIGNGHLWTVMYARLTNGYAESALPAALLIDAVVVLPWCVYVLAASSRAANVVR